MEDSAKYQARRDSRMSRKDAVSHEESRSVDSVSPNPETEKQQFAEREVPLTVSGRGVGAETGESFTEQTTTKAVFETGAVVRLSAEVNEGQTVRVRNGENGREAEARVAKSFSGDGGVKSVELQFAQAQSDFWATAAADAKEKAQEGPIEIQKHEPSTTAATEASAASGGSSPTPATEEKVEVPSWMKVNKAWEGGDSYPIRMQLPKAAGEASPRTAEFAADSATITAAQDEYLLPKPSLDFEQFPGLAEEKTRLLSGTARRSLSGPIGAVVVVGLLIIATTLGAYRLGWLRWPGKKVAAKAVETSPRTSPNPEVVTTGQYAVPIPLPKAASKPVSIANKNDVPTEPPDTASEKETAPAETDEPRTTANKAAVTPNAKIRSSTKAETKSVSVQGTNPDGAYEPPVLIKAIRSLSPPEALQAFVSGVVVLDALVDEHGKVISATPISGPKALYEKAAQTAKEGYLYRPATRNGKPVPAHVDVRVQFWYEP